MLLYRRIAYGNLAEFNVLDTRQYRDDQAAGDGTDPPNPEQQDPARTLTGDAQEAWLLDGLSSSSRTWNVLAQQVFMAQRDFDTSDAECYSMDAWDGYLSSRNRILGYIEERNIANPVVLTGDVHNNWANNLKANFYDQSSRTLGVEFVGTSITSGGKERTQPQATRPWLTRTRTSSSSTDSVDTSDAPSRLRYELAVSSIDSFRAVQLVVCWGQFVLTNVDRFDACIELRRADVPGNKRDLELARGPHVRKVGKQHSRLACSVWIYRWLHEVTGVKLCPALVVHRVRSVDHFDNMPWANTANGVGRGKPFAYQRCGFIEAGLVGDGFSLDARISLTDSTKVDSGGCSVSSILRRAGQYGAERQSSYHVSAPRSRIEADFGNKADTGARTARVPSTP